MLKESNTIFSIIGLMMLLVVIIIIIVCFVKLIMQVKKTKKETFFSTPQTANISPITGVIKGTNIMTNGMTRDNINNIVESVKNTGKGFDTEGNNVFGVGLGNGFDKAYENQQMIQEIDDNTPNGYQTNEDLNQISKLIGSTTNNANNNLFTRAGSKPIKLTLDPTGVKAIIDEKYLPDRDKNHKIYTVGTVIPVQGYDVKVERIGEELTDVHFSKISNNKKTNRVPTKSGAETLNTSDNAIKNNIAVTNSKIYIKDNLSKSNVSIPLDENQIDTSNIKFVRANNTIV